MPEDKKQKIEGNPEGKVPEKEKKKPDIKAAIKNITKRERMLSYLAGFFILLVLLDKLTLTPILNRIEQLEEEINQQMTLIQDGLMIIGYKDTIMSEFESLNKYFIEQRKTQEEELADFLKDMENLAGNTGVQLVSINPSGTIEDVKLYSKYKMSLDCTGTMDQLMSFVYEMSIHPSPTKIETIDFVPPGENEDFFKSSMTISRMLVSF